MRSGGVFAGRRGGGNVQRKILLEKQIIISYNANL